MSAIPSNSGIGTGLAQVLDTRWPTQVYIQNMERRKQQEMANMKAVQTLLAANQGKNLRPKDMELYDQKYNELRSVLYKNPGLINNPSKNMDDYNKVSNLIAELHQIKSYSDQVKDFVNKVGSNFMNNHKKFSKDTVDLLGMVNDNNSYQIIDAMGKLPDITMVQYRPEQPDPDKWGKQIKSLAESMGGVNYQNIVTDTKADPSIPKGTVMMQTDKLYDPVAVGKAADLLYSDPEGNFAQYYDNVFDENKDFVAKQQEDLNKLGDKAFKINSGQDLFRAESMLRFQRENGKPVPRTDYEYKRKAALEDAATRINMNMQAKEKQFDYEQAHKAPSGSEQLWSDAKGYVKKMQEIPGTVGSEEAKKKIEDKLASMAAVFANSSLQQPGKPQLLRPNTEGISKEQYIKNMQKQYPPDPAYELTDKELEDAYHRNKFMLFFPTYVDKKGVLRYAIVDPYSEKATGQVYELLRKGAEGTRTKGAPSMRDLHD